MIDSLFLNQTAFHSIPECIKLADASGKLVDLNSAGLKLIGADSIDSVRGKSVFDLIAGEDRAAYIEFHNRVCNGRSSTKIFKSIGMDGRLRIMEASGVPIAILGQPAVLTVTRDITDRLRLEHDARDTRELNRQIVESAREGIIAYDCDLRYIIWNPFVERLSGKRAVDVIGKLPWDVFPFLRELDVETSLRRALAGESLILPDHPNPWGPQGSEYWLVAHLSPLRNSEGEIIGVLNFLHDIHRRKLVERSLQLSHRKLNNLSQRLLEIQELERHRIARELHDEIGQVLTAIKMKLQQTSQNRGMDREVTLNESIKMVDDAVGHVRHLSLSLRPVQLDELGLIPALRGLIKQFASCEDIHIRLETTLPELRLASKIEIVCFRIAQEAITNAIRHANARNISIRIAEEDRFVFLSIHDDGVGMDINVARTQTMKGESFGLSGMEERAVLVDGHLSIHSAPGQGTTIDFRAPSTEASHHSKSNLTSLEYRSIFS